MVYSTELGCDSIGDEYSIEMTISKLNNSFLLKFNDTCAENSNYSGKYNQLILDPIQWDSLKIHFAHSVEFDVIVHRHKTKDLSKNSHMLDFDSEILLFFHDMFNNDNRYTRSIEVPEIIMFQKGLVIKKRDEDIYPTI